MTRKERAITNLKQMCSDGRYLGSGSYAPLEVLEDFEVAIKALEKEPKNDLGVDAVSKKVVLEIYDEWFDTCNIADKKESPKAKINALSQVTPIRPKGYWVIDGTGVTALEYIEGYRQIHCTYCGHKIKGKNIEGTDFCPNCGADMREVKK